MIPREVYARWSPMWHRDADVDRPWWVYERPYGTNPAGDYEAGCLYGRIDGVSLWAPGSAILSTLAEYDARQPMPAPLPMPGQVWAWDGVEAIVEHVEASSWQGGVVTGWTIGIGGSTRYVGPAWGGAWPIPGAVLVAGPTPWGRDVPWAEMGLKS